MKIDGTNLYPEAPTGTVTRPGTSAGSVARETASATEGVSDAQTDRGTVAQLAAQLQGLPEVRASRVETLRQAIKSGQYHVSDQQIADALHAQLFEAGSSRR